MITQKKKTKGLIFKVLLTVPVFALLLLANCTSTNNKSEKAPVTSEEVLHTTSFSFDGDHPTVWFNDSTLIYPCDTNCINEGFNFCNIKDDTVILFEGWPDYWYIERLDSTSYHVSFIPKNDSIHDPYKVVEKMPEYPGGTDKLLTFISENINYPQSAMEKGIEGKCYIDFVIDIDGSVTDAHLLRGFDEECDAEALRVVNLMPKWKPGKHEGKPVRVQYMIPIAFKLK